MSVLTQVKFSKDNSVLSQFRLSVNFNTRKSTGDTRKSTEDYKSISKGKIHYNCTIKQLAYLFSI